MSDGVADALTPDEIREIVVANGLHNPKAAADAVLNAARERTSEDDMTVMALRILEDNKGVAK